jgi:hypothetical protein
MIIRNEWLWKTSENLSRLATKKELSMWIEDELYRKILERMPIPTVDVIIVHKGKFLLLRRNNPPVKGE